MSVCSGWNVQHITVMAEHLGPCKGGQLGVAVNQNNQVGVKEEKRETMYEPGPGAGHNTI